MGKILLFYNYTEFTYPKRIQKWQQQICNDLGLKGRILIAKEGLNGTVGGTVEATERYKEIMKAHPQLGNTDFKESPGGADCFPRMQVLVKDEIVHLGVPKGAHIEHTGVHLTADQTHELLNNKPEDLIVLDTRNDYEYKIGSFRDAVKPDIKSFREFPAYIDAHVDEFKDKQVLMFCTGGVRCERATAYLKEKGVAKEVYQIEGGIHRYAEKYPDGHFRGKNYVFDGRIAVPVNDDVLAECSLCPKPCDDYTNCINAQCNKHYIACVDCVSTYNNCCSTECQTLVAEKKVNVRTKFVKVELDNLQKRA